MSSPKCGINFVPIVEKKIKFSGAIKFTPAEKIAALLDALKELGVDVPQWQPIETAPKDGTEIVLLGTAENSGPMLRSCISRWWDKKEGSPGYFLGWCYLAPGYCDKFVPTHWMPLPKPPKED